MLSWPPTVRIFLRAGPPDKRKRFDSLAHLVDRLAELLPDVWFEAHPQARRKKVA